MKKRYGLGLAFIFLSVPVLGHAEEGKKSETKMIMDGEGMIFGGGGSAAAVKQVNSEEQAMPDETPLMKQVGVNEANVAREGNVITLGKDSYRLIPKGMKVYQVGSNVIRAEDPEFYSGRTMKTVENKMEQKIQKVEGRLDTVEEKVTSQTIVLKSSALPGAETKMDQPEIVSKKTEDAQVEIPNDEKVYGVGSDALRAEDVKRDATEKPATQGEMQEKLSKMEQRLESMEQILRRLDAKTTVSTSQANGNNSSESEKKK